MQLAALAYINTVQRLHIGAVDFDHVWIMGEVQRCHLAARDIQLLERGIMAKVDGSQSWIVLTIQLSKFCEILQACKVRDAFSFQTVTKFCDFFYRSLLQSPSIAGNRINKRSESGVWEILFVNLNVLGKEMSWCEK